MYYISFISYFKLPQRNIMFKPIQVCLVLSSTIFYKIIKVNIQFTLHSMIVNPPHCLNVLVCTKQASQTVIFRGNSLLQIPIPMSIFLEKVAFGIYFFVVRMFWQLFFFSSRFYIAAHPYLWGWYRLTPWFLWI